MHFCFDLLSRALSTRGVFDENAQCTSVDAEGLIDQQQQTTVYST